MNDIKDLKVMVNKAPSGEFPVWEDTGRKFDSEKPKMYLLPPKATVEVAKVLTFGAAKYDEENWRKLEDAQKRYSGGALRHIFSHLDGELQDPETNLSHLAHAICCLMFKLELELETDGEAHKEEELRKLIEGKHRESYSPIEPHRYGIVNPKTDY
jgi:hypothetical protein